MAALVSSGEIGAAALVSSGETRAAVGEETLRVAGILIKHEGSRCRVSWKNPEGWVISATTATARLGELRD